jgi:hypothetical protein
MIDLELKNALNKFLKAEVLPNTYNLEIDTNSTELCALYIKLTGLGLFNPNIPFLELHGILTEVSKYDASLALTMLANHHAHSLLASCKGIDISTTKILTTEIYNNQLLKPCSDMNVHYISGFTNTLISPVWKNNVLEIGVIELERNLSTEKVIGAKTSPLVKIKYPKNSQSYKSAFSLTDYNELIQRYRIAACAIAIGLMDGSFQTAKLYSSERTQGGRFIKDWSQIQMQLAELNLSVITSKVLLNQANLILPKTDCDSEDFLKAISVKILNELNPMVDKSISVLGGFGYMKEYPQEKRFRDAKHISLLFNGSNNYLLELGS